ncbi:SGNH/GDSL hydrolase family protein [Candidatus Binatia bacterium]|nr:SGNH/GDSL hydrolase family protein [Candidatus Binatia bacterium]
MTVAVRSTWRRWLSVGAVCAGLVVGLALGGELVVRVFFPQEHLPPGIFVSDPNLGYRVARNYEGEHVTRTFTVPLRTNSLGLRDREYGPPGPDTLRIYFLGDSFIFGNRVPLEDTVTKVLERQLAGRLGSRTVEVVNGGMPGYSTVQELKFFEETVDRLQPGVVLLALCIGNDIWDNLLYVERNVIDGGGGSWRGGGGGWRARLTLLLKHSDFYLLIRRTFNAIFRGSEVEVRHQDRPAARIPDGLRLTEQAVLDMARGAWRRGAQFAVLLIPVQDRIIALDTQRDLNDRFRTFAEQHDIPVYDLRDHMPAEGESELYYTVHWTPRGHAVVADAVEGFLARNRFLDGGAAAAP